MNSIQLIIVGGVGHCLEGAREVKPLSRLIESPSLYLSLSLSVVLLLASALLLLLYVLQLDKRLFKIGSARV